MNERQEKERPLVVESKASIQQVILQLANCGDRISNMALTCGSQIQSLEDEIQKLNTVDPNKAKERIMSLRDSLGGSIAQQISMIQEDLDNIGRKFGILLDMGDLKWNRKLKSAKQMVNDVMTRLDYTLIAINTVEKESLSYAVNEPTVWRKLMGGNKKMLQEIVEQFLQRFSKLIAITHQMSNAIHILVQAMIETKDKLMGKQSS